MSSEVSTVDQSAPGSELRDVPGVDPSGHGYMMWHDTPAVICKSEARAATGEHTLELSKHREEGQRTVWVILV